MNGLIDFMWQLIIMVLQILVVGWLAYGLWMMVGWINWRK